jgi:hypothetical protein
VGHDVDALDEQDDEQLSSLVVGAVGDSWAIYEVLKMACFKIIIRPQRSASCVKFNIA